MNRIFVQKIYRECPVVATIILLNVCLFLAMVFNAGTKTLLAPSSQTLLDFGANSASATIIAWQYWRLFSYCFVHVGLLHVALNMYVLWDIGREVERLYGSVKFLFIYFYAAVGGAITSLLINPMLISAGASGGIFGVFGAMLAIAWRRGELFPKGFLALHSKIVACLILYTIVFSFFDKNLDNAAHFGGLVAGFAGGLCLLPQSPKVNVWSKAERKRSLVLVVAYLALLFSAHEKLQNRSDLIADDSYRKAVDMLNAKKSVAALALFDRAVALSPNDAFILHDRARAYVELKQYDKAIADCNTALKVSPDDKISYATRASAYHKMGVYQKSVDDLTKLVQLSPQSAMPLNNRAWSYEALGKYAEALADCNAAIKINDRLSTAYDTRALAYIGLSQFQQALNDLEKAISIQAADGAFYYHRAIVFRNMKQDDKAALDSAKARELGYEAEPWEPK